MSYEQTHERVMELVPKSNEDIKIIDLGCGKGGIIRRLRNLGFKDVTYCDKVDSFDNNVFICNLNKNLPLISHRYDLAICTEVIEHLENKQLFFREVRRILKKDGLFIFSTPNVSNLPNRLIYFLHSMFIEFNENELEHIQPFFRWQLPDFFEVEKITYNRGFIPLLRIPFFNSNLFGQTLIMKCGVIK